MGDDPDKDVLSIGHWAIVAYDEDGLNDVLRINLKEATDKKQIIDFALMYFRYRGLSGFILLDISPISSLDYARGR